MERVFLLPHFTRNTDFFMPYSTERDREILEMIRTVYPTQGWKPIADCFSITKFAVLSRARSIGVQIDKKEKEKKKEEINQVIREVYPTQGWKPIAERFGLTQAAVQVRARRVGVQCLKKEWYERASKTRTDLFDTLDLSIWYPELTDVGAYYLGLAWADATTAYRTPDEAKNRDSHYFVQFCQSGEDDKEVVYSLAKILGLSSDRVRPVKKYKDSHLTPYRLKLCGKRVASLFIDHFGIPMRKSYIDPPYPRNIEDYYLPAFACGLLDGDGSAQYYPISSVNPHYAFYGSPVFLEEFRCRLAAAVGVDFLETRIQFQCNNLNLFGVYDVRQTVPLTRYLYQYYGQDGVPYMRRKHDVFEWFLKPGYFTFSGGEKVWI